MGLPLIALYCLIENMFSKKNNNKFLVIMIFLFITFPIFLYLLNGGLYAESKVLITFIPLVLILISETISRINKKFEYKKYFIYLVGLLLISLIFSNKYIFMIILDFLILYNAFRYMVKENNLDKIFIFIIPIIFIMNIAYNCGDFLVKNTYVDNNEEYIDYVLEIDNSTYRFNIFDMALNTVNRV